MAVTSKPAKADDKPEVLAPATEVAASGAVIEPGIAKGVDMSHPSVDANPRSNSTADMNRVDFNNPSAIVPQEQSVLENLTGKEPDALKSAKK